MSYVLTIHDDGVFVSYATSAGSALRQITSAADFGAFMADEAKRLNVAADELAVFCSSSLDFPEESTSNRETIALAKELR